VIFLIGRTKFGTHNANVNDGGLHLIFHGGKQGFKMRGHGLSTTDHAALVYSQHLTSHATMPRLALYLPLARRSESVCKDGKPYFHPVKSMRKGGFVQRSSPMRGAIHVLLHVLL